MNAVSYTVAALQEPLLCLPAANALRDVCDANRSSLAPHIGAFAELHAGLTSVPVRIYISLAGFLRSTLILASFKGHGKDESAAIYR